jgi:hypothetical protein
MTMTGEELTSALRELKEKGLDFGQAVTVFAAGEEEARLIAAARDEWHRDGEVEIDQDVVVSRGDDNGAYVMAWVWVTDPDPDGEVKEVRAGDMDTHSPKPTHVRDFGDDRWIEIKELDQHGDTVLVTGTEDEETTFDIDTVVEVVIPTGATRE